MRMSLYRLVLSKSFHIPVKLEHNAYYDTKYLNYDLKSAGEKRLLQIVDLMNEECKLMIVLMYIRKG